MQLFYLSYEENLWTDTFQLVMIHDIFKNIFREKWMAELIWFFSYSKGLYVIKNWIIFLNNIKYGLYIIKKGRSLSNILYAYQHMW